MFSCLMYSCSQGALFCSAISEGLPSGVGKSLVLCKPRCVWGFFSIILNSEKGQLWMKCRGKLCVVHTCLFDVHLPVNSLHFAAEHRRGGRIRRCRPKPPAEAGLSLPPKFGGSRLVHRAACSFGVGAEQWDVSAVSWGGLDSALSFCSAVSFYLLWQAGHLVRDNGWSLQAVGLQGLYMSLLPCYGLMGCGTLWL